MNKYPIADMGKNFQPDAMADFDARVASGEFADLTIDQIREVYVREELEAVEQEELLDSYEAPELGDDEQGD